MVRAVRLWFGGLVSAAALVAIPPVLAQTQPASPAQAPAAPAGNAETGRKLYTSYGCYQCHGYEGQGGAAGPRLAPRPVPWPGFSAYVRRPANVMPPYTARVMPDQDLAHIYAYLQARPAPPPVESIPLLQ